MDDSERNAGAAKRSFIRESVRAARVAGVLELKKPPFSGLERRL